MTEPRAHTVADHPGRTSPSGCSTARSPSRLVDDADPRAIRIEGVLLDGRASPCPTAWSRSGRRTRPAATRIRPTTATTSRSRRFLRLRPRRNDDGGRFEFVTVKPGRVPWPDGRLQAPHLVVGVFARGLLKRVVTRIYFPDEAEANAEDPVLLGARPNARATLVAGEEDGGLRFDIRLQGAAADDILRGVTPFAPLFVPAELREAVSDRAWLAAMLDAERRARAGRRDGAGSSRRTRRPAIAAACSRRAVRLASAARRGRRARQPGRAARPRAAGTRSADDAAGWVHLGATSQDVMDTAAMLVAAERARARARGPRPRRRRLRRARARAPRRRRWPARTLLQQAVPTTFGLKAAGWLDAMLDARGAWRAADGRLAAQLGGAAGTLAALGDAALEIVRLYAGELEPRGADRCPGTRTACGSPSSAPRSASRGAAAKIALDLVLLAQTEVGEVSGGVGRRLLDDAAQAQPGRLDRRRAPARGSPAATPVLLGALVAEHERAAGAWQAEWEALSARSRSPAARLRRPRRPEGLEVDAARMRRTSTRTGGLVVAERVALCAHARDWAAPRRTSSSPTRPRAGVVSRCAPRRRARGLSADELDLLLDPATYLGAAEALVDRALAEYDEAYG